VKKFPKPKPFTPEEIDNISNAIESAIKENDIIRFYGGLQRHELQLRRRFIATIKALTAGGEDE